MSAALLSQRLDAAAGQFDTSRPSPAGIVRNGADLIDYVWIYDAGNALAALLRHLAERARQVETIPLGHGEPDDAPQVADIIGGPALLRLVEAIEAATP